MTTRTENRVASRREDGMTSRRPDNMTSRGEDRMTSIRQDNMTSRGEDRMTSRRPDNMTSRGEDGMTSRRPDNMTSRGEDRMTSRRPDNVTSRGEDRMTSIPPDNVTSRGEDRMTSIRPDNMTSRGEERMTSRRPDNMTSRGEDRIMSSREDRISSRGTNTMTSIVEDIKTSNQALFLRRGDNTSLNSGNKTLSFKDRSTSSGQDRMSSSRGVFHTSGNDRRGMSSGLQTTTHVQVDTAETHAEEEPFQKMKTTFNLLKSVLAESLAETDKRPSKRYPPKSVQENKEIQRLVAKVDQLLQMMREMSEQSDRKRVELERENAILQNKLVEAHDSEATAKGNCDFLEQRVTYLTGKLEGYETKEFEHKLTQTTQDNNEIHTLLRRSVSHDDLDENGVHDQSFGRHSINRWRSTTTVDTRDTGFSETIIETIHKDVEEIRKNIEQLFEAASTCPTPTTKFPPLPPLIRGFCVNIQDSVSSEKSRMNNFSRCIGVNQSRLCQLKDEHDYKQDLPSVYWAVIYEWNSINNTEANRATMLDQLIQACDACWITNPLSVRPMPTKDRLIIEKNYSYLVEHLMVRPALVYLRDSQKITPNIVQYVQDPQPNPDQVQRFVEVLPVCGGQALDIFVDALQKSGQQHIANTIVATNPERFRKSCDYSSPMMQEDKKVLYRSQNIAGQTKKKSRFKLNFKPFRIFKSKKYSLEATSPQ
ncbi:uncharacterized protein LOC125382085 isoform X1 [Haliotis rufescens]|uniref:uncharacterized protein LOC125382085 isoform X1 n=1 Tax=Haliotis rufescens TaxID=6454 RepID=UPI00201F0EF9|nr:uncharacterized protein LOC125382085 isoform X1 [Haliotis rufescens]